MANVKFDGVNEDLTAPNTPWIYYGVCVRPEPTCVAPFHCNLRGLMLVLERHTCGSYTRTWSLERSLRVVSTFKLYPPTEPLNPFVLTSGHSRFHSTMGVHGRHPQKRKSEVFIAFGVACFDHRFHALGSWHKEGCQISVWPFRAQP